MLSLAFTTPPAFAQEPTNNYLEGKIVEVLRVTEIESAGSLITSQVFRVELVSGSSIEAESGIDQSANRTYETGDKVIVRKNLDPEGNESYIVTDYVRRDSLLALTVLFILVTLIITRRWGLTSIIGMIYSFFIIFKILLPQILAGSDPITVTIISALFIIPVTFYLSHGINTKTTTAIMGTLIALVITGALATFFVYTSKLSGLSSEESGFLFAFFGEKINTRGLLLAGIIIGSLGVLDDVTISQAAVVEELKKSNVKLSSKELFQASMRVGHDHITSMVNTLILVYAGASLPLLLLFLDSSQKLGTVINQEIIAEEIIRTLVSSIGIVLAVPITSMIASANAAKKHFS